METEDEAQGTCVCYNMHFNASIEDGSGWKRPQHLK